MYVCTLRAIVHDIIPIDSRLTLVNSRVAIWCNSLLTRGRELHASEDMHTHTHIHTLRLQGLRAPALAASVTHT